MEGTAWASARMDLAIQNAITWFRNSNQVRLPVCKMMFECYHVECYNARVLQCSTVAVFECCSVRGVAVSICPTPIPYIMQRRARLFLPQECLVSHTGAQFNLKWGAILPEMLRKKISICGVWWRAIFWTRDLLAVRIICCSESWGES